MPDEAVKTKDKSTAATTSKRRMVTIDGNTAAAYVAHATNEVIAAGEDEYKAAFTERFSKWGSTEDAFKYWGKRVREVIDETQVATK